jgi:hypothetical protein
MMGWLRTLWVGWVVLICVSFFLRRFLYQFFPLWDALLVFVFFLTVRGVGEAVLKKLGCWEGSFLFRHVTALAAGFLPFSLGMFALGLFGGYQPAVACVVLFLLALAVLPGTISFFSEAKAWGRHVRRSLDAPGAAWLALIGAASLGPLAASLVPSTYYDSLVLYLGFPWRYTVVGGLEFMPYNYLSFLPQNVEMLTTFLLLLHRSPFGPQLGNWAMGLVSAAAVYVLARQWLPRSWALCAGALFYTTPTVLALGVYMKNDLFIAAAALVSLSALCRWFRTGAARWMVLTGLLWGFWAGAKYPGVYALACGAAMLVAYAVAAFLRPAEPEERSRRLKAIALGIVVAAAVASPWYVRNTALTGNPVYPAYRHVFSTPEFQGHAYEMRVGGVESVKQWLRLPWDMTMYRGVLGFPGNIGIWYLAFLPPALFWLLWRRRIPQEFSWLLVYAVLLYGIWSLTFMKARFILVAFGIGCVAIALGFRVWARESRASKAVLAFALVVGLPTHAWLSTHAWLYFSMGPGGDFLTTRTFRCRPTASTTRPRFRNTSARSTPCRSWWRACTRRDSGIFCTASRTRSIGAGFSITLPLSSPARSRCLRIFWMRAA